MGSRRHSYLRPLLLEPAWAPGQDEIRTRGANRCATASWSQRSYRLFPVSVGPSSSVASFAFVGGKALTGFSQPFVSGRNGFRSVLNVELRLKRHASRCHGPDDPWELVCDGHGGAVSSAPLLDPERPCLKAMRSFRAMGGQDHRPCPADQELSLIHISEPTRLGMISYAVFCLKK